MKQATDIITSQGFEIVHGIVDSLWLRKHGAKGDEYEELCKKLREKLNLPISYEGQYKWIVFLNSTVDLQTSVLNRYYGVFQDNELKVRGIELRRHDTPGIVNQCQKEMLDVFEKAASVHQFHRLLPEALKILAGHVSRVRNGNVSDEELLVAKGLSKNPGEYMNIVPQAIAARQIQADGGAVHAGQMVRYLLTLDRSGIKDNRANPSQLVSKMTPYDNPWYEEFLLSTAAKLLMPIGFDKEQLRQLI